jgi:hypothetical protein
MVALVLQENRDLLESLDLKVAQEILDPRDLRENGVVMEDWV